jgi:glycosyltransferase involved in cell wall biosynthesis
MLAPEFLPVWGGVGTYIVELVRHLPRSIEIHVVTPFREKLGPSEVKTSDYDFGEYFGDNVHVHLISSASDTFFYNAAFQYACFKQVPRLVREMGIDLLHSHTAHMPDLLLQFRRLKTPTVTTVHTTIVGQRQGSKESRVDFRDLDLSEKATFAGYPFLRLAEIVFFSKRKWYITVSNWMKVQLQQRFPKLEDSDIRVIPNSVDTEFFSPGKEGEKPVVLFTGRLIAAKGLTYFVDSVPGILRSYPDTVFIFIGPGNSAPYEARLRRLGVPRNNFQFLGYLKDQGDLLDYYRKCTVFVAPTLYENLPIRILEAMACARPVVATDVCAIPEVITPQHDGVLVPPGSSEALGDGICSLLGDRERRMEIGRRARQTVVDRYDWSHNAKKTFLFYEEVLAS